MQSDLAGKVIWITGASGALGRATISHLLDAGACVVGSSRTRDEIDIDNTRLTAMPLDVTDFAATNRVALEIVDRLGRIDGLVTFAAASAFGDFLALSDEDWHAAWDTKLMGAVRVVRASLPYMIDRGAGSIVLISGRGGLIPPRNHLPGASANAGLNLIAQGLATQYGANGIRVNALSPGPIKSDRLDAMVRVGASSTSALGKPGTPNDVANATIFLLSDAASHITGVNLVVDGGRGS